MRYLGNGFSLSMLPKGANPGISEVTPDYIGVILRRYDVRSIVGHENTAAILSDIFEFYIPFNRETISLEEGDVFYVAQYSGPRLPEGATALPEGASFRYFEIRI